jgi:hypothetical protein
MDPMARKDSAMTRVHRKSMRLSRGVRECVALDAGIGGGPTLEFGGCRGQSAGMSGWAAGSLNQPAAECNPSCCGGRVLNVDAGGRTTNDMCDRMRECGHFGLKHSASRRLPFENSDEYG